MSTATMVKRAGRLILAGVVFGGLTFGASQLIAGGARDCPYPPYHGPCDPNDDCYDLCIQLFPLNEGIGHCNLSNHCCICAER
jgi:hypothetical protein